MIFVFIAGTYTPFALLAFSGVLPAVVLACVWTGAALGVVLNVSWIDAPKWVIAPVYLLVGWVGVIAAPQFFTELDVASAVLVAVGGVLYTLGAHRLRDALAGSVPGDLRLPRGLPRPRARRGRVPVRRRLVRRSLTRAARSPLVPGRDSSCCSRPRRLRAPRSSSSTPGHDLRGNPDTEPIGPGSTTRKIKDGGGTRGVVSGLDRGRAEHARRRSASAAARARRRSRRHDADEDRRGRAWATSRARASRTGRAPRSSSASTPTARPIRARAAPTRSIRRCSRGWTDDVYAAEQARGDDRPGELVRALGFPDRGLQERSDFTGFNWADVPVILVEMGFMTNRTDDRLLATATYQRRAAAGLCRGALRFLGRPALSAPDSG